MAWIRDADPGPAASDDHIDASVLEPRPRGDIPHGARRREDRRIEAGFHFELAVIEYSAHAGRLTDVFEADPRSLRDLEARCGGGLIRLLNDLLPVFAHLALYAGGLAMRFIELLCTRLRWTSEQVEELILQNLSARLASALVRLVGRKTGNGSDTIDATQQQLSEMVGISRESTNKQLVAWAAQGWVRLEHGAIVVLKPDALREVAEREEDGD